VPLDLGRRRVWVSPGRASRARQGRSSGGHGWPLTRVGRGLVVPSCIAAALVTHDTVAGKPSVAVLEDVRQYQASGNRLIARLRVGRCAYLSRFRLVGRMRATREDLDGPGAR
jgi:hypothetical protein